MKDIYISGKIKNATPGELDLFRIVEEKIRADGNYPINPYAIGQEHPNWTVEQHMKYDIGRLLKCAEIAPLTTAKLSDNAILEIGIADAIGIKVNYDYICICAESDEG